MVLYGSQEHNVVLFHLPTVIMLLKRTHRRDDKQSWVLANTWCLQQRRVSMRKEPPVSLTKLNTDKSVAQYITTGTTWKLEALETVCSSVLAGSFLLCQTFWLCCPLCNYTNCEMSIKKYIPGCIPDQTRTLKLY